LLFEGIKTEFNSIYFIWLQRTLKVQNVEKSLPENGGGGDKKAMKIFFLLKFFFFPQINVFFPIDETRK